MKESVDLNEKKKAENKAIIYKEAFELFDKNADGQITINDIKKVFECMGEKPTKGDIQDMITETDTEGNGCIKLDDFTKLMDKNLRDENIEEEIIETFKVFDQDKNGLIGGEEVYNVMKTFGLDITKFEADEMIKNVDLDQDGFVNYEEFVKMLFNFDKI